MMKLKKQQRVLTAAKMTALLFLFTYPLHGQTEPEISRSVIATGGGTMNDQRFIVQATVGQPAIGISTDNEYHLESGLWGTLGEVVTSVNSDAEQIPAKFELKQNYPNPFNPSTTIRYSIAAATRVVLRVYDILGRQVATLVDEDMQPGRYRTTFSAVELPSGVYFYQIQAGDFQRARKLIVIK